LLIAGFLILKFAILNDNNSRIDFYLSQFIQHDSQRLRFIEISQTRADNWKGNRSKALFFG